MGVTSIKGGNGPPEALGAEGEEHAGGALQAVFTPLSPQPGER